MSGRTNRWVVGAALAALILGAMLSRVIEPGVRIEKTMLTTNTPALRISPATAGPHPIALLAHGNGGSKEMCFRFGEALAAAGFDCYLGALPVAQRRTIELAYFEGLSQSEIAVKTASPLGTVKMRVKLAMAKLAELLGDENT